MSIRGMQATLKNNEIMKSKRRSLYDRKNKGLKSGFGDFEDHKKMNTHEFADFQKELFHKRKRARRILLIKYAVTIILTILVLLSIPILINLVFSNSV